MSKIHYAPNPFRSPWLPGVAWTPWDELRSYDDIGAMNISYPFGFVPFDYQVRGTRLFFPIAKQCVTVTI